MRIKQKSIVSIMIIFMILMSSFVPTTSHANPLSSITNGISSGINSIKDGVNNAVDSVKNTAEWAVNEVKSGTEWAITETTSGIKWGISKVENTGEWLINKGGEIYKWTEDKLVAGWEVATGALIKVKDGIVTLVKDVTGLGGAKGRDVDDADKTSAQREFDKLSRSQRINKAMTNFMAEYKVHLAGFMLFGILTSVLSFVYNFIRLGAYASNPTKRSETIHNLIVSGICASLLGSIGVVMTLFYYTVLGVK